MKIESQLTINKEKIKRIQVCVDAVLKHVPDQDLQGIEKLIVIENREKEAYNDAGGMYYLERDGRPAFIELYLKQIVSKIPKFVPRTWIFFNYSIINMLLHEIGHHVHREFALTREGEKWEMAAGQYAYRQLWDIYGFWMVIFLTIGSINRIINQ